MEIVFQEEWDGFYFVFGLDRFVCGREVIDFSIWFKEEGVNL